MPVEKEDMNSIYEEMCTGSVSTSTDSSTVDTSTDIQTDKIDKTPITTSMKGDAILGVPRATWMGTFAASCGIIALIMAAL